MEELGVEKPPVEIQQYKSLPHSGKQLSAFELAKGKTAYQKVLNYTNGNKTEAARLPILL